METTLEVRDVVRHFIVTNFYVPEEDHFADDASLLEAGIVDSTGVCEVIEFLSRRFGVRVEDREMTPEHLDTIAAIVALVQRKLG
jgi:acyl carrier protein